MICRRCNTKMDLVQRSTEEDKVRLTYVCPKASCQETSLVVGRGPGARPQMPAAVAPDSPRG